MKTLAHKSAITICSPDYQKLTASQDERVIFRPDQRHLQR